MTAVAYADEANTIFTGSIDNQVTAWDIRKGGRVYSMRGHTDTVTYLALHPKGTHILSNSMDSTIRSWDIRPFVQGKRHCKTFRGGTHNAEKGLLKCSWSPDGKMVSGGSADRMVHIWDELTTEEVSFRAAKIATGLPLTAIFEALSASWSHWLRQLCGVPP